MIHIEEKLASYYGGYLDMVSVCTSKKLQRFEFRQGGIRQDRIELSEHHFSSEGEEITWSSSTLGT